jgi:very-short-patch-repair endonuclease
MTLWGYFKRWDAPLEVIVTEDRRPSGIRVHLTSTLACRDLTSHLGIRVTTPARTLFDVASRLRQTTRARVVNDALVGPYMSEESLVELLGRHPHAPATKLLTPFVHHEGGPTRSELEDAWRRFAARSALPNYVMNVPIGGYLADVYFPEHSLIVEIDSYRYHSTRVSFESDRDRDADTLLAGIPTVRITDDRMTHSPVKEADRLHRILDARAAELTATP